MSGSDAASGELPRALKRKLEALEYPDVASARLGGEDYYKVILWLEEAKIRLYEQKNRKKLRNFDEDWYKHAADYAKELGVPAEGLNEKDLPTKLRVLNGLASVAIHDIYRDQLEAKELNLIAPPKPVAGAADKQQLRDLVAPLNRILEHLKLPKLQDNAVDTDTIAALRSLKTRLCQPPKPGPSVDLDLDKLPHGCDTEDKAVRDASGVLRLLHSIEMGQLQVNINHVINDLQQITADPKTDASLGKVGT